MGYRSEVAYVITFDTLSVKQEWVALAKLNTETNEALKECRHVDDDKDYISAYFSDVKWYEGYEDVDRHMNMLNEIGEAEDGKVNARFLRVGESADDVEDNAYGDNGWEIELYVSRTIDTTYDLGPTYRD